jgi:prepilin-type N-terminal cleavage/methylation domain-containing protein
VQIRIPRRRAFTLVEIMIVVLIIGLLAAIAVAVFDQARRRSLATRYANDFNKFEAAFQQYTLEHGGWPPASAGGTMPTGMSGLLPERFVQSSAMGGLYSWTGDAAQILLSGSDATDAVMEQVDKMIDDGNLGTGSFTSVAAGSYQLQL